MRTGTMEKIIKLVMETERKVNVRDKQIKELEEELKAVEKDRDHWCKMYNEQLDKTVKLLGKYEPEELEY